ncbi:MAG: hypothetical protein J6Q32_01230 [Clostridia bacterium]|nr:hypothetical protein [Clostridia bacterium]
MPRINRAAQFAPFDALKGLQDAIKIKEYEQERASKGEITEEKAVELSKKLVSLEKNQLGEVTYFFDGYYKKESGKIKLFIEKRIISVNNVKICLDDVSEISLFEK